MDTAFATVLAADLAGPAGRAPDPARRAALDALRAVAAAHGGRELSGAGTGLLVTFAGAAAAVRCAVEMQRAAAAAGTAPPRIGIAAGETAVGGDGGDGPALLARRLCDAAASGGIVAADVVRQVAGPSLEQVVRPAAGLRLPGIDERVATAEVLWRDDADADDPGAPPPETPSREITVVVADDQRLLRAGFRVILDSEPDMRVVGEAADGEAAVDVVRRRRPDVVLMDIRMPGLDGLAAAERILSEPGLRTAVVMLTTFDRDEYVFEALRIGASGFLLKDTPADRLLDAVRVAADGDALLAPSITRRLVERFARAARPDAAGPHPRLAALTAREREVLRLVAGGLSNAEIAAELVLGESTVKTHVARLLSKLGLRDRVQAVVLAYETGFVTPAPDED